MKYTGIKATTEEIESLKSLMNQPYLVANGVPPLDPLQEAHKLALAHGLPEIPGYYGCDLKTGEFVQA